MGCPPSRSLRGFEVRPSRPQANGSAPSACNSRTRCSTGNSRGAAQRACQAGLTLGVGPVTMTRFERASHDTAPSSSLV